MSIWGLTLWAGVLGSGVMAGIYFAFSGFIMRSLAELPPAAGIAAMQSINDRILSSAFMPLFAGTSLLGLGVVIAAIVRWGSPGAVPALAAGALYVVGMFVCTAAFNVPLNNQLAAAPAAAESAPLWDHYVQTWTVWNHVRTVASATAAGLFLVAVTQA
ncbi:MAG: anthrone oxygenase family protein [Myxococcota bacterium]